MIFDLVLVNLRGSAVGSDRPQNVGPAEQNRLLACPETCTNGLRNDLVHSAFQDHFLVAKPALTRSPRASMQAPNQILVCSYSGSQVTDCRCDRFGRFY